MYLTKKNLEYRVKRLNSKYWTEGWKYRWQYMLWVIEKMMEMKAVSVLEMGAYYMPLNDKSFLIELDQKYLVNSHGVVWNLNKTPYPIKDKEYDVSVGLQVWEHLEKQREAFMELRRISKNVILSFPYRWDWGDAMHRGIDDKKISQWTCGVEPTEKKLINHRMIYVWSNV